MGQKVNPVGYRTGVFRDWKSRWYAPKEEFANLLVEDKKIQMSKGSLTPVEATPKLSVHRKLDGKGKKTATN